VEAAAGFSNPVIPGFHPDPSVCRVGDEFYLATSSFTYYPGVPVFRSPDLVAWTQIGNVIDRRTQMDLTLAASTSQGVFAPTLRFHDGRFWMITTGFTDALQTFFITAEDPAGPWSEPTHVAIRGIDPDIAWDEDGACWVHHAVGQEVFRTRIDDATGAVLEESTRTWSGTGSQYPEAPHLYRIGDRWYLLIAEGGTERGHGVSIARSSTPTGPWESCPANPVLSHRSTNRPIQNTGHADLVEAVDGSWWMVLLGVRPRGITPRFHVLGRETFLVPIAWEEGWPVVGPLREDMPARPPGGSSGLSEPATTRDDFDGPGLAAQWLSVRTPLAEVCTLTDRAGWLTLLGRDHDLDQRLPAFVGRRQQHHVSCFRALVDPGDSTEAGVCVRMDEQSHYEVFVRDGEVMVRARIGPVVQVLARRPAPPGPVVLRISTSEDRVAADFVELGFETAAGELDILASLDGRYVSTEVCGGFTGRVTGVYAVGGTAHCDWADWT
jgi:xylan 1,4-beta-xylosidase